MSLKLTLKPHEKVIIGGAVITNGASSAHLRIENNVPVLRQADIMTESEANTPCRCIYLTVQLMYIDEGSCAKLHPLYWDLVKNVLDTTPDMKDLILQISQSILEGKYYQALKLSKKLISCEKESATNVPEPR